MLTLKFLDFSISTYMIQFPTRPEILWQKTTLIQFFIVENHRGYVFRVIVTCEGDRGQGDT